MFNNIFSIYDSLIKDVLTILVDFINKFARYPLDKLTYSIKNIHLGGDTTFKDQAIIKFCRSLKFTEYAKKVNCLSSILDTDGLSISIDRETDSFKCVRLKLTSNVGVKVVFNFTFAGYLSVIFKA